MDLCLINESPVDLEEMDFGFLIGGERLLDDH